jgi:hypothetical protein
VPASDKGTGVAAMVMVSWSLPLGGNRRCAPQCVDPAGHLATEKVGCQKLRGQRRIEMKYCTQLWSAAALNASGGKWGGAVLPKTPIRV